MGAWVRLARVSVLAAAVFAIAAPVSAQDSSRFDITFGYQALKVDDSPCADCSTDWYSYGCNVDGGYKLRAPWTVVGEFYWSRHPFDEDPTRHNGGLNAIDIGGGMRWMRDAKSKIAPYAQLTLGFHRDFITGHEAPGLLTFVGDVVPQSAFMVHPSGGVYFRSGDWWGFIGQVGYRHSFTSAGINGVHFVAGIRLNTK